mgnify:CR=1 FL=1
MLIGQVILGGITRLTGSGLSITSWDIITGVIPPMNKQEWLDLFELYKNTPQYHKINADFTLKNFKFICVQSCHTRRGILGKFPRLLENNLNPYKASDCCVPFQAKVSTAQIK